MDAQTIQQIKNDILKIQAILDEALERNTPKVMPEHDLDIALTMYADHLKADYNKWNTSNPRQHAASLDVTFERGRKFIKVVKKSYSSPSVHSFICIQAHGKFQFGDILKAASWGQPAKNFARGNVLNPKSYADHRWTGA
jgi:hypothetical protein